MPTPMKRSEAKAQIRAAILALLQSELAPGNRLTTVRGVYDGERVRSIPELPAIFLIRENENVTQQNIHQTIDYDLSLLAIVSSDDPSDGLDEAEALAAEASAIATASRDLGLRFVNDCKLISSTPVSGPHTERRRVGAIDLIRVTYTILQQ